MSRADETMFLPHGTIAGNDCLDARKTLGDDMRTEELKLPELDPPFSWSIEPKVTAPDLFTRRDVVLAVSLHRHEVVIDTIDTGGIQAEHIIAATTKLLPLYEKLCQVNPAG